jgi:hypothetical protein
VESKQSLLAAIREAVRGPGWAPGRRVAGGRMPLLAGATGWLNSPAAVGTAVRFSVRLDGQPPGPDHGEDVDDDGAGTLTEPRLHQLVRQRGPVSTRTFEITFHDPGVRAYAFTFG